MNLWQDSDHTDDDRHTGVAARYATLVAQHQALETALAAELARARPEDTTLHELKRRKLRVKDELFAIERLLAAIGVDPGVAATPAMPEVLGALPPVQPPGGDAIARS